MKRSAKRILFAKFICFMAALAALTSSAQTSAMLDNMPLYFEANQGQANVAAQFIAHATDSQFSISSEGVQMFLRKSAAEIATVRMRFVGANPAAQMQGDAELAGKINYRVGNDPAQWLSGISTFAKVGVAEIYPGVGLVYYGNQKQLEYDFTIAPGANPNGIVIRFDGMEKISVNAGGELVLTLSDGEIHQPKPVIYQMISGARKAISGGYKILDAHTVTFSIGEYDHALPLVIDPILSYSTYFGGTLGDVACAVAVNTNDGSIYIAGETLSKQFYYTPGAFQTNFGGGTLTGDAFVAKFDNSGQNLIYLTYLGGNADDGVLGLAVDAAGDAFVTGFTDSPNFPTTNAIYPHITGTIPKGFSSYPVDAFVTELDSGGSNLIYSTYLGGSGQDTAYGIAVDSSDNAYVTGYTYSTNFPTTNAIQNHLACSYTLYFNANAFVTEIASNDTSLVFSTYLGGTNFDEGQAIAVDSAGYIYVTGYTSSTNFPTWNTPTNLLNGRLLNGATNNAASFDAFVTKFPPFTNWIYSASNQIYSISNVANSYSTFLGGTNNDIGRAIACDAAGDAFIAGYSTSTNFPDTVTNIPGLFSYLATNNAGVLVTNAFLTEINPNGSNMVYSILFGGQGPDVANGVAVDAAGDAFVIGSATSTNFPATTNTLGNLAAANSGDSDVFVTAISNNASGLIYSGYIGGNANDYGYGIALDSSNNAYIVGQTLSSNFPTNAPYQAILNGSSDAFVAEIILNPLLPEIIIQPTNQPLTGAGATATFNVTATGTTPLSFQWQLNGTNLTNGAYISGASSVGIATNSILTIYNAQTTNSGNYTVIVTNGAGSVTSSPPIVLTVTNAPVITVQPTNQTVGVGSTVTFYVNGGGILPVFLQWLKDGTNLMDGTNISGSTNNVLTITDAQTNDDGNYWLFITNSWGSTTSAVATLTVLKSPSFSGITAAGASGNSFILNGVGGTNSGKYYVLASSNLATPFSLWTPIATNQFGSQGQFVFTNTPPTNTPQQFYILQWQVP